MKETSQDQVVPVAYVTKYVGRILIMRNMELSENGPGRLWTGWQIISPKDWTDNKEEAEKRYKAKLKKKVDSLKGNIKKLEKQLGEGPMYTESRNSTSKL